MTAGRHSRWRFPPPGVADGYLASLGRWCFENWLNVVLAWVMVAIAGVMLFGAVFAVETDYTSEVESSQARKLLDEASTNGGTVIALVDGVSPRTAGVCDAVGRLTADLGARTEVVQSVASPCPDGPGSGVGAADQSAGSDAFLVTVTLAKIDNGTEAGEAVDTVSERMRELAVQLRAAGQPQAKVLVGGEPAAEREFNQILFADGVRSELMSLPLSMILLVLVLRGLLAGFLPVVTAIVATLSAFVVLLGFSELFPVAPTAVTILTLLGLGLSIDYGLLLVGRYREEVAAGYTPAAAVSRANATAGRAILFSGLTVTASLTGPLVLGLAELATIGAAAVSIAVVVMSVALTLTPALLGAMRPWITPARRRVRRRAAGVDAVEANAFARLARAVQRRPGTVAVVTSGILLLAGTMLLGATTRVTKVEGVPGDVESIQVLNALGSRFGITQQPAVTVVARTDEATLNEWARRWNNDTAVVDVRPAVRVGPDLATVDINVVGDSQSRAAQELVDRIRADRPPGVASWVTGDAAELVDVKARLVRHAPLAVAVTMLAMMAVLFLMTGSLVVPVKAIVANVVSLGATYGVMVLVFERGFLTEPLGLLKTGGLDPFILVTIFAFAFGLAMDYEVFLLSRIKEYVDLGYDTDSAVRLGLAQTGRIITSAAALMVIVFASFATARLGIIEQFGFGLAVAVLVDATIVRCLLVPATMTLMGRWNWWAPAPLRWVYERLGLREATLPGTVPVRPPPPVETTRPRGGRHRRRDTSMQRAEAP